jgi:hypothetical protein
MAAVRDQKYAGMTIETWRSLTLIRLVLLSDRPRTRLTSFASSKWMSARQPFDQATRSFDSRLIRSSSDTGQNLVRMLFVLTRAPVAEITSCRRTFSTCLSKSTFVSDLAIRA